jgi:hypothetical protein
MKIELATLSSTEEGSVLNRLRCTPGLSGALQFAQRQLATGAMHDNTSGAYLFGPNPSVAPFAFHLVMFPSLTGDQIERYERMRGVQLPVGYKLLLMNFNGLRAGRTSIYGLLDVAFQKNPEAEAAYVPFDVIEERNKSLDAETHRKTAGSPRMSRSGRLQGQTA